MGNTLKVILWLAIIALVAYLIFGRGQNKAEAPISPEESGGAAGERAETNLEANVGGALSTDADAGAPSESLDIEVDSQGTVSQ